MAISYKHKIYTILGTPTTLSEDVVSVTNSVGVPTKDYTIKGKTIVWNQLLQNGIFNDSTGWTGVQGSISVSNNVLKYIPNSTTGTSHRLKTTFETQKNGKYFVSAIMTAESAGTGVIEFSRGYVRLAKSLSANSRTVVEGIMSIGGDEDEYSVLQFFVNDSDDLGSVTFTIERLFVCNLTLMFGTGNEPATAAEFRTMFPNDYYSYEPGVLKSISGYDKKSEMLKRGLMLNKAMFAGNNVVDRNGIDFTYNNGSITINGTATAQAEYRLFASADSGRTILNIKGNTKYLFLCHPGSQNSTSYWVFGGIDDPVFSYDEIYAPGKIVSRDTDKTGTCYFILRVPSGKTANNEVMTPQLFNLSAIFGLGNEPSTVAEFLSYFPSDQYDYTTGEKKENLGDIQLQSSLPQRFQLSDKRNYFTNTVSGVTFTNNGDGTMTLNGTATATIWRPLQLGIYFIPIGHKVMLSGTPFAQGSWRCLLYDGSDSEHGSDTSGTGVIYTQLYGYSNPYFYVAQNYVCDNLVFKPQLFDLTEMFGLGNEPTTTAEFWQRIPEALYKTDKNAYRAVGVQSSKYFPDGMRSAGSVYDEINFSSQKAIKRIGSVDLGTLNWTYESTASHERFTANVSGMKLASATSVKGNIVCSKYITTSADDIWLHTADKTIASHNTVAQVWVYDSAYTDAAAFKSAMSGVMLYYELATSVETTITPSLQALSTFKGFTSFSAPNSLTQNGPFSVTYYAEGGENPEKGWLTSYKRKLYMGKNIEWNQLFDKNATPSRNSTAITYSVDGDMNTLTTTSAITISQFNFQCSTVSGHKYMICAKSLEWISPNHSNLFVGKESHPDMASYAILTSDNLSKFFTATGDTCYIKSYISYSAGDYEFRMNGLQLFDLTQMFGAGNEPETTTDFWSYFPNKVYPYNAGETQPLFKISRKNYLYSVEQPKLAAPTNLSISGSVLSFDSVEGATSYNILADGTSIGVYVPS